MENVTHSLTGLFLSHAGLNRVTPRATAILILAANAPDADIVTLVGGGLNYFHFHRHLTHSLLFMPVVAALAVALVRLIGRRPFPLIPAFLVALCGVASHLLLDLTNAYGVRILLPFSSEWFRWDITNVFDIWIWTAFGVCLAAPFLSRLVGGEIGSKTRSQFPGRGFPVLALLFLLAYDSGRAVLHARVVATLNARIYGGTAPVRVLAFPPGSNPLHWHAAAETETAYHVFEVNVTQPFDIAGGRVISKAEPAPSIEAAQATEPFRVFREFASFPVWRTEPAVLPEGGTLVTLRDLRFPFFAEGVVTRFSEVQTSRFAYGR